MQYYDLFISIGPACRPAYHLSNNLLRNSSAPLDWQMSYTLDTVIHLFNTNFQDFFVDIEEAKECGADNNRRVIDKKNNIISIHHFSKDLSLEDARIEFYKTMQKRYINLNKKLKSINKVVFMCNRNNSKEDFVTFLTDFRKIYPNLEIRLINIRNDSSIGNDNIQKREYSVSNNISIVEYIFNDSFDWNTGKKFDWRGNRKCWNRVLEEYELSEKCCLIGELENLKNDSSVVVFGAGETCKFVLKVLQKSNINVIGIAVSDINKNSYDVENIPVRTINAYQKNSKIIIAIHDEIESKKVKNSLKLQGYHDVIRYNLLEN